MKYTYIHRADHGHENHQHHRRGIRAAEGAKKNEKTSFSDVIVQYYPVRRKLADVLTGIGNCSDLAGSVEKVSRDMRKSRMKTIQL